jgi:hypothetical protein
MDNYANIGNNIPPGFNDKGEHMEARGSSRYNHHITKWEKDNKDELFELEVMIIKDLRFAGTVHDADFQQRLKELKSKFPKQANHLVKKHWR